MSKSAAPLRGYSEIANTAGTLTVRNISGTLCLTPDEWHHYRHQLVQNIEATVCAHLTAQPARGAAFGITTTQPSATLPLSTLLRGAP